MSNSRNKIEDLHRQKEPPTIITATEKLFATFEKSDMGAVHLVRQQLDALKQMKDVKIRKFQRPGKKRVEKVVIKLRRMFTSRIELQYLSLQLLNKNGKEYYLLEYSHDDNKAIIVFKTYELE